MVAILPYRPNQFRSNKKGQEDEIYKSNIFWLESHLVRACGIMLSLAVLRDHPFITSAKGLGGWV